MFGGNCRNLWGKLNYVLDQIFRVAASLREKLFISKVAFSHVENIFSEEINGMFLKSVEKFLEFRFA